MISWLWDHTPRLLISLVALALLFELYARLDDLIAYNAPFFKVYSYETMLVDRDEHGGKGRPHGRFEKWVLNSHGFRSPEIEVEKPPGVVRIVTFGASETFGLYESPGMEWPSQLRASLERLHQNRRIEVINAARAGLSLESSLEYFKHRVLEYQPDILLYYQGFSEYMAKGAAGRKERTGGTREASSEKAQGKSIRQVLSDSVNQTRIYPKLKLAFKQKGPRPLVNWLQSRNIHAILSRVDKHAQIRRIEQSQIDYYGQRLREFVTFLKENGVRVVLSEHDVNLENRGVFILTWKYLPSISEEAMRHGYPILNNVIRTVADETDSMFVEQGSLLRDPEENFAEDGVHLTDRGAQRLQENFLPALERALGEIPAS